MAVTDAFKTAVSVGNVRGIRIMMKDSMLFDPTFERFNEMERIAQTVNGLYDAHDGREMIEDNDAWDEEYMDMLMVQVVRNFSHDRIAHLKKVVRKLRPVTVRPTQSTEANRATTRQSVSPSKEKTGRLSYEEQKYLDEQSGNIVSFRGGKIAAGAVVGGVVGGAIAGLASASVLTGAAVGAVVVGTVVAVTTNGEG